MSPTVTIVIGKTQRKRCRNTVGAYLVETLVALVLGTLFAFALLNILAETMRLTSSNENRQSADLIVQSVLDSIKRTDPSLCEIGTYTLLVNSQTSGERGPAIHPLPVGLNIGDFGWNAKSKGNKFQGSVILDIKAGASPETKNAVVTAIWSDASNIGGKKTGTLTSVYSKGINYWP